MTAPSRVDRVLDARRNAVGRWEHAPDGGYFALRGLDLLVPILRAASGVYVVGFAHPRLLGGQRLVAFAVGFGDDLGFDIGELALHPAVEDMAAAGLLCATWAEAPAALRPGLLGFLVRELDPVIRPVIPAPQGTGSVAPIPCPIPDRFARARRPSAQVVPGPAAWSAAPPAQGPAQGPTRRTAQAPAGGRPASAAPSGRPSAPPGGLFRRLWQRRAGAA